LRKKQITLKYNTMENQNEITKQALLEGKTLTQLNMLFDYGIGNHTAVISRVRKALREEGIEVVTEFKTMKSKKTGKIVRFATYYIPEKKKEETLWQKIKRYIG